MTDWNARYLDLAKTISQWSKDPSSKIGAVAIGQKGQVLAQGYNGFPRGIIDLSERYQNRETKYKFVVHAEMNCIYNATYNGISLDSASLYVWGLPICSECAKGIIQVGIRQVFWGVDKEIPDTWIKSLEATTELLSEANVKLICLQKP
jgi:dCMP deaminase